MKRGNSNSTSGEDELLAWTTLPDPFTPEEGLAFIERQWSRAQRRERVSLVIEERHVGVAVGCATVMLRRDGVADLGYWLIRDARGRGIGRQAVSPLVPWTFQGLNVEAIEAFVDPDNQPSRRILEGCGFSLTGSRHHSVGRIDGELLVYRRGRIAG